MAARKQDRAVIRRAKASDNAIGSRPDVCWLLAIRASVAKQEPAGTIGQDLARLPSFVVAVVPLQEVGIDLGSLAEPGQRAGARRALKRAREDFVKRETRKAPLERARLALALFRQRNVGAPGVPAACAPFRFAVSDESDTRQHDDSSRCCGRRSWTPSGYPHIKTSPAHTRRA